MKTKLSRNWMAGALSVVLCLAGGRAWQTADAQDQPPPPPSTDNTAPDSATALPPGVYPSSPFAQVVRLAQAGVSEDVIMAYVTNSGSTFNLNPDRIIYLKDIGVPDSIVTAMMQRDQVLQLQMVAPAAPQPPLQPAPDASTVVDEVAPPPPTEEVTVNYFYDTLAPYGAWVDVDGYGRCWRPTVMIINAGWQPYCDHGHWVYTDDGWYWMSDYSWGWAAFHYGRWFHHARFGWCWCPDTVWGPSWVTWRYSGDYCGWAPLPPRAVFREGVGFVYNGATVSVGFDFGLGASAFTFVRAQDFCDPHPRRHRIESREVTQIFDHTTVINNFDVDRQNRTFINHGIDPQHIADATHAPIHPIAIREATGPVARGEQLGRDGRTLIVDRLRFTAHPEPSMNKGVLPHAAPLSQPTPQPVIGSPYQPPNNNYGNNNPLPQRQYEPVSPMQPPGQPQTPPVNRFAPSAPVQPLAPNNSTDNRRYPSPRMQQYPQPNPRLAPGNYENRVGQPVTPPAPAQPPQHNYGAPYTGQPNPPNPSRPDNPQPRVAEPPQRSYVAPRNEPPANNQSQPNYSQPPASGGQSRGSPAPASSGQSQKSGKDKNQN